MKEIMKLHKNERQAKNQEIELFKNRHRDDVISWTAKLTEKCTEVIETKKLNHQKQK
jgi:hypothetical protein